MGKLYRPVSGKYIDFKSIILPVGFVYISYNNVDPNTLFYGTWVRIAGQYLMAGDPSSEMEHKTIGAEIGSWRPNTDLHTLTVDQMPKHRHGANTDDYTDVYGYVVMKSGGQPGLTYGSTGPYCKEMYNTGYAGGGQGHQHKMPNYPVATRVLNVWRRSA